MTVAQQQHQKHNNITSSNISQVQQLIKPQLSSSSQQEEQLIKTATTISPFTSQSDQQLAKAAADGSFPPFSTQQEQLIKHLPLFSSQQLFPSLSTASQLSSTTAYQNSMLGLLINKFGLSGFQVV